MPCVSGIPTSRFDFRYEVPHPSRIRSRFDDRQVGLHNGYLQGDLRNEKDMREAAEASVMMWKATSAALGLSTLGCAAVALIAISRCRT